MDYSKFEYFLERNPEQEKLSINHRRLDYGEGAADVVAKRETITLNFLLTKGKGFHSHESLEREIMRDILFIDNLKLVPENTKNLALELTNNKRLVKVVLRTVFQWLGTGIGSNTLTRLHDILRDYADERTKESQERFKLTMEIRALERKKFELEAKIQEMEKELQ